MKKHTGFTRLAAELYTGGAAGKTTLSTATDLVLTEKERAALVIGITATAASKAVTLELTEGQVAFVINEGATNAFTVKNLSGDTGTSVAAGKVALVIGSAAANGTKAYVLN